METRLLVEQIERVKAGDEQGVLFIAEHFKPLLKKYARKLKGYDDTYEDLKYTLVKVILTNLTKGTFVNDGAVKSYIRAVIENAYKEALDKIIRTVPTDSFCGMSEEQLYLIEGLNPHFDDYSNIHLSTLKGALTEKEFGMLFRHYIQDISISEIAEQDGITRQTANKTKIRAISKLKKVL